MAIPNVLTNQDNYGLTWTGQLNVTTTNQPAHRPTVAKTGSFFTRSWRRNQIGTGRCTRSDSLGMRAAHRFSVRLYRRVFAWADADAVSNGYSGPSNAIAPGSRAAKLNNYSSPEGGPAECRWSVNNCGPNDEPFSFHAGGLNATMGDGSVKFLSETIDGLIVKWMIGADDGQTYDANL